LSDRVLLLFDCVKFAAPHVTLTGSSEKWATSMAQLPVRRARESTCPHRIPEGAAGRSTASSPSGLVSLKGWGPSEEGVRRYLKLLERCLAKEEEEEEEE
jgi:hypothetical protein